LPAEYVLDGNAPWQPQKISQEKGHLMPTVLRVDGYRFFFYSLENNEPAHIHVERGDNAAKYWLNPVGLAMNDGFRSHELTFRYVK
jgi:hypothetical protein